MTLGPPPSAAGPSHSTAAGPSGGQGSAIASVGTTSSSTPGPDPAPGSSIPTNAHTSQYAVQTQPASRPYYATSQLSAYPVNAQAGTSQPLSQTYPTQTTYYPQQPPPSSTAQPPAGNYSYYGYPSNAWANAWNTTTYQYPSGGGFSYSYAPQQSAHPQTAVAVPSAPPPVPAAPLSKKTPTPPPSPPPEYHREWDSVIKSFLSSLGFSQTLRGFEADMVVLNPEWERRKVPTALGELMKDLLQLGRASNGEDKNAVIRERPLEERKLDYVHFVKGAKPHSHTSITKDISRFLAQNRARNDASNRNEFLLSIAEKRRRLNENGDSEPSTSLPSCARTDAKTQNRDLQMRYDIAKNEDGPLRRTMKTSALLDVEPTAQTSDSAGSAVKPVDGFPSAERYPGLDERLQNVEKHLAVRYVPSPPQSLLNRLKYLEDHIIHLEKEYPPWAALHFNQPNRGWPPPPRATPIIVPSHLTSTATKQQPPLAEPPAVAVGMVEAGSGDAKIKSGRRTKSSLHRAVMERLEVQKAMNDLAGG